MDFSESAHLFSVEGVTCTGILHSGSSNTGVLIIVGGPQYRVGSHRQYVRLARFLAAAGIPTFRFDSRGMGDSAGTKQPFDQLDSDINAAIDTFITLCNIDNLVVLGLCDAAASAWLYAWQDNRISGLVLINPWLKDEHSKSRVMLKHYYPKRFFDRLFWKKLFTGKVNYTHAVKDVFSFTFNNHRETETTSSQYQNRMLYGAEQYLGKVCLVLSGIDLTAKEFEQVTSSEPRWGNVLRRNTDKHTFSTADHTFSDPTNETQLFNTVLSFIRGIRT